MKQKNGGGKRFVVYRDEQPLTIEDLKEKDFAGNLCDMTVAVCDATETAVFEFPGGTIDRYLQSNGLYPSSTHFYIRTQPKESMVEEFDDSHDSDTSESVESTLPLAEPINNHGEQCSQDKPSPRVVCEFCGCTYVIGETCIRCQLNEEFQASKAVDSARNSDPVTVVTDTPEEEVQPPTLDDIRRIRVAHFVPDQPGRAHDVTIDGNFRAMFTTMIHQAKKMPHFLL